MRIAASTAAEICGQRALGPAYDPVECGDGALARCHGERQQLGDGRELLRRMRALPLAHLSGQVLVAGEDAD